MLDIVQKYTNKKYNSYCQSKPNDFFVKLYNGYKAFAKIEIKAAIGLLLYQGAYNFGKVTINDLWSPKFHSIF